MMLFNVPPVKVLQFKVALFKVPLFKVCRLRKHLQSLDKQNSYKNQHFLWRKNFLWNINFEIGAVLSGL